MLVFSNSSLCHPSLLETRLCLLNTEINVREKKNELSLQIMLLANKCILTSLLTCLPVFLKHIKQDVNCRSRLLKLRKNKYLDGTLYTFLLVLIFKFSEKNSNNVGI